MRAHLAYLLVLLLAGCAATPNEVREEGLHLQSQTWRSPEMAAACMGRTLNNQDGNQTARVNKRADGAYEVIVRIEGANIMGIGIIGTVSVIELREVRRNVTRIDAWSREGFFNNFNDAGIHGLMAGCGGLG